MTRSRKSAIELASTIPAPASPCAATLPAPASTPGRPSPRVRVPEGRHGAHRSTIGPSATRPELRAGQSPADLLAELTQKGRKRSKPRSDRKPVATPFHAPAPTGPDLLAGFAVPVVTANESNGSHQHWRTVSRRRKHIRAETTRAAKESGCPVPAPPLVVTITRHSAGTLDDDGARSAGKAIRDAVAKWLGVDDKDSKRVLYTYEQAPCSRGLGWVTVEIRRMEK